MKSTSRRLHAFLLAAGLAAASAGCTMYGRAQLVSSTPPPPPARVISVEPRPGYAYIQGRWDLEGGRWVWRDGYWIRQRTGYVYDQGYWDRRGSGYVWVEGRWEPQRSGHVYVPGHWQVSGGRQIWVRGHWRPAYRETERRGAYRY